MAVALPLTPIDLKTPISRQSPTASELLSCSSLKATGKFALHGIDLGSSNCLLSSAPPSHNSKLPVVLEENEPQEFPSHRKGLSVWNASSVSSFRSITSSSASSTLAFLQRTSETRHSFVNAKNSTKPVKKRSERKKISFISVLLQPLKTIRDGYVSCMMGFDGAGDLSGLVQGSVFASPTKYFADKPKLITEPQETEKSITEPQETEFHL